MIRHLLCAIVLVCALAATASATTRPIGSDEFATGASVITFETGSTGLPSVPGVTFLDGGPWDGQHFGGDAAFCNYFYDRQVFANLVSTTFSDLGITFSTPVPAVGGWVGRIPNYLHDDAPFLNIRAYDAAGRALASDNVFLPALGARPVFYGVWSSEGIARIEWLGGNTGFFGVDNVTYGNITPEPATLLLLAGAMLLIGIRRL